MKMKHTKMRNSIIAGPLARELEAAYKPDGKIYHAIKQFPQYDLWVSARACTIKRKPSGGAIIYVDCDPPKYESMRIKAEKRIKSNDPEAIRRHAADLIERVRQQRSALLIRLRESVFELAESMDIAPDKLPAIEQCYDSMTEQDCNFWKQWIPEHCQPKQVKEEQ
jgi:hypothetical protein